MKGAPAGARYPYREENSVVSTPTTSTDVYAHYRRLCGGTPVLTEPELRVEVRATGLRYEELDDTFWAALFRRPDHRHLP